MKLIILCVLLLKVHQKYILNFEELSSDGHSILSSGYSNRNQIEQISNNQMNPRILQSKSATKTTCQECEEDNGPHIAVAVGISIGSLVGGTILMYTFIYCCCKCMRKKDVIENGDTVPNNNDVIERAQNGQHSNNNVIVYDQIQLQIQIQISNQEQQFKQVPQSIQNIPPENSIQNKESNQREIRNCLICLDDINSLMQYEIKCPFRHVFHKNCIDQWLLKHQTCPQCRGQISST